MGPAICNFHCPLEILSEGNLPSQGCQVSASAMSGPFFTATGEMQTPRGKTSYQWEGSGSSIFHAGFLAPLAHPFTFPNCVH